MDIQSTREENHTQAPSSGVELNRCSPSSDSKSSAISAQANRSCEKSFAVGKEVSQTRFSTLRILFAFIRGPIACHNRMS